MDCFIVVPVYKSEETLPELVERLNKLHGTFGGKNEIILVKGFYFMQPYSSSLGFCHSWSAPCGENGKPSTAWSWAGVWWLPFS